MRILIQIAFALVVACAIAYVAAAQAGSGPVGYWKLNGDLRDYSGNGNHADLPHDLASAKQSSTHVEIRNSRTLQFGSGDFTVSAWIRTSADPCDGMGDLINKYDPARRSGFTISSIANGSGYNSNSNSRRLFFGTDNDSTGAWVDCGRPGGKSHSSDALTVFHGDLYVGTTD